MDLDTSVILNGFAVAVAVGIYTKIGKMGTDIAGLVSSFAAHVKADQENFETVRADVREIRTEARGR